ncbi:phosphoadenosine phosphosulfate reductase family protein, partial [candidate division WOR-3 bacterium]|nr:phosphoadenosine phosphosulfate reductase family protein [candidate division WOR-3 bacterium]MBD3364060.1 phosphoadenosine phosphosulfate reductase family protein [candidate division WOR-3 bacterium]
MSLLENTDDIKELVNGLHFKEKIDRSLQLIDEAYQRYGDRLVVANSLGKDSVAVWDLAKKVAPKIRGFVVTTRYKPKATKQFMRELVERYPETRV